MHPRVRFLAFIVALAPFMTSHAAIKSETVDYQDGDDKLRGYIYYDDQIEGKRPGVIVVHEWWGLDDYARGRAERLAKLGYVAFAIDMYGKGRVAEHGDEAKEWMTQITANIDAWQRRALLALDILKKHPMVDAGNTAAIGYCFGGATVMQMAYSGADLKAVASLHGSLPPATPEQAAKVHAMVYVAHGADDAFVPKERVDAFRSALNSAGVDVRFVEFPGVRHSFTVPDADKHGMENLKYNKNADETSWQQLQETLSKAFK